VLAEGGRLAVHIAFATALLLSIDERAEHGLDHGFDGRIIDALGLRQLGRDGFEVATACRWRQRHRSLAHDPSWLSDKRRIRLVSARFITSLRPALSAAEMEDARGKFIAISLIARGASGFAVGILVFLGGRPDQRFEITELTT